MSVLRRVLAALLPPGVGAAALADLDRELAARRRRGGRGGHAVWYAFQGLLLVAHLRGARLGDALAPRGASLSPPSPFPSRPEPMDRFRQNLRLALRRLRRSPGFALAAVATLALGVGANVAVFSVVDAVLLEPLPFRDPDALVALWEWNVPRDRRDNVANPGNVRAWRERATTLDDLAYAVFFDQPALVAGEAEPREVMVRLVTPNFFDVLGVEAALGRTFSEGAGSREGDEFVLTDRYWRQAFGGAADAVGRTMTLADGTAGAVVGVLPPGYVVWGERSDVYAAFESAGDQTNTGRYLNTVARLREGATVEQARQDLASVAAGLREEFPDFNAGWGVEVVPLRTQIVGGADAILWVLLGAVGLLLLIACGNVSNLFLARATARRREMAVRSSLGASRRALATQLLVESALVAGLGAVVGVAVAYAATALAATRLPDAFSLPRVESAAVDGRALLFAVGVTVLTALLFGLVPALHAARAAPGEALAEEGRATARSAGRARAALVVGEVALSLVLLVGAGLLGRSLASLLAQDLGIEPRNVVTARVSLVTPRYRDAATKVRFLEALVERVASLPRVQAAGIIPFLPLDGLGSATSYWAGDAPVPGPGEAPVTDVRNVAGDYFGAMGIALLRGRGFDGRDGADGPRAVVVSRALAEEAWPGRDPLGRPLVLSWGDPDHVATVVGVVEDVRLAEVESEPRAAAYYPVAQFPDFGAFYLVVRSPRAPADLRPALAEAVHAIDPALALGELRIMERIVGGATARPRMTTALMGVFAAIAAALAAVGLYGVLSYAVSQRFREIGLRMALGAPPRGVLIRVVGNGMALVAGGILLGLTASLAASRLLAGLLFGIPPNDPPSLVGAALFLAAVGLVACALPAWRATRVDPAVALRSE